MNFEMWMFKNTECLPMQKSINACTKYIHFTFLRILFSDESNFKNSANTRRALLLNNLQQVVLVHRPSLVPKFAC